MQVSIVTKPTWKEKNKISSIQRKNTYDQKQATKYKCHNIINKTMCFSKNGKLIFLKWQNVTALKCQKSTGQCRAQQLLLYETNLQVNSHFWKSTSSCTNLCEEDSKHTAEETKPSTFRNESTVTAAVENGCTFIIYSVAPEGRRRVYFLQVQDQKVWLLLWLVFSVMKKFCWLL